MVSLGNKAVKTGKMSWEEEERMSPIGKEVGNRLRGRKGRRCCAIEKGWKRCENPTDLVGNVSLIEMRYIRDW
jgi:hypothetical protein